MRVFAAFFVLFGVLSGMAQSAPPASPVAPATTAPAASPKTTLLPLPPPGDPGARKAGELLTQMVQAMGGEAYLQIKDMVQEGRTYGFSRGEPQGAGAPFVRVWHWPDQERTQFTYERESISIISIVPSIPVTSKGHSAIIFNGDKGYEITYRGTEAIEPEVLQDYLRRRAHSLQWVLRKWFAEPGISLFYEGEVLAERKHSEQISISNGENEMVTIAIDTSTHLPVRVSFIWRDPKTHDRIEESEAYDNYRLVQGIMTPLSIIRYRDGNATNQKFLTSVKFNQGTPESMFEAKITPAPPPKKK
jgi:hypothetical protein